MTTLDLTLPARTAGARWLILDAQLEGSGDDFLVCVVASRDDGVLVRQPVSVTMKGRIREVIHVPFVPVRLFLETVCPDARPKLIASHVKFVGSIRAKGLMALRVWRYWRRLSSTERRLMEMRFPDMFCKLERSNDLVQRLRYHYPEMRYSQWLERCDSVNQESLEKLTRQTPPSAVMHVIIHAQAAAQASDSAPGDVSVGVSGQILRDMTILSLKQQIWPENVRIHVLTGSSVDQSVYTQLRQLRDSDWICVVAAGVRFVPWMASWVLLDSNLADKSLVYSDHDLQRVRQAKGDGLQAESRSLENSGEFGEFAEVGAGLPGGPGNGFADRFAPVFKPDWSPELAMVTGYFGQAFWMRAALWQSLDTVRQFESIYPLFMQAEHVLNRSADGQASHRAVGHIASVLWHAHEVESAGYAKPTFQQVGEQLALRGLNGKVVADGRGQPRVVYENPDPAPCVSIIIPTRNLLHMLQPCVESVLAKTTWPNFEVIVVDNQSDCDDTLAYMQALCAMDRVRVLSYDHPFNFAAIQNFAVQQSKGELICLLNNDTEVITPGWLDEMVGRLSQPDVGVVGARLLYGDGRLQHAGDVLGAGGCASHLHGPIAGEDPGYMNRAVLPQDLSAVTAACLLVRKSLYEAVGGFDADNVPVAFNDVDFC